MSHRRVHRLSSSTLAAHFRTTRPLPHRPRLFRIPRNIYVATDCVKILHARLRAKVAVCPSRHIKSCELANGTQVSFVQVTPKQPYTTYDFNMRVVTENSVRAENAEVPIVREILVRSR